MSSFNRPCCFRSNPSYQTQAENDCFTCEYNEECLDYSHIPDFSFGGKVDWIRPLPSSSAREFNYKKDLKELKKLLKRKKCASQKN